MGPILLTDTDTEVMEQWCSVLHSSRLQLLPTFSAEEALDLLQRVDCSILVSGHRPGQLDAESLFEACRIYRPLIRGLVCSANIDAIGAMRAAQLGFDDIVYMPFEAEDDLERSIYASLQLANRWQERLEEFDRPGSSMYWQAAGFQPSGQLTLA